jgi:DNA-binding CsgD family transcriptional regulator
MLKTCFVSIEPVTSADRCDLLGRSSGLTMRETELLQRIATGGDTRSLAKQMHLSEHTVQDHLKSIFAKTGASSRRDLLVRVGCR